MVQIEGQTLRVSKELRVEVEKNPDTLTYRKIETQTLVTEIQPTEETEEQLRRMEERFQARVSTKKSSNGAFKGLRMVDQQDLVQNTQFQKFDVVNEWSKLCENGKFKRQYSSHELLGKGTYGEVYRVRR
jgi:hypothetical protein